MTPMNEELVTIATFQTASEAAVARIALEAEGIKVFVTDDQLVGMTWIIGNAVGYVKLLVGAPDAERARRLLEAQFDDWSGGEGAPWNCPHCGEEIDAEFDECWSCGTMRPAGTPMAAKESTDSIGGSPREAGLILPPPDSFEGRARAENPYASPLATETAKEEPASVAIALNGDELARRAWRASVFGLVMCPPLLNFYSAWLLLSLAFSDRPLSNRGHRHMSGAWAINLLAALGAGLFYGIFWVL